SPDFFSSLMFFLLSATAHVRARAPRAVLCFAATTAAILTRRPRRGKVSSLENYAIGVVGGRSDVDPDLPAFRLPFTAPDGQRISSLLARVNPQARLRQHPQLAEAGVNARAARVLKRVAELRPVDKSRIEFKTGDAHVSIFRRIVAAPRLAGDFDVDIATHRL